ncbi:hypothetical protein chiPu_0004985 [Chiloscyllium punctatum]|uniref:Reverse transcriptase domain-containing protein n=1 Tax=Chiloscyllium punctatum TaxID=137246 RepID=A0A401S841_CHIPU|nr:hypothetical protein [Chiloscyllium punctatum]
MKGVEITLQLKSKAHAQRLKVLYTIQRKVESELQQLVNLGALEPVITSEWVNPIIPVLKPDGMVRLYGDFKITDNPALSVNQYLLPLIEDLFSGLARRKKFSEVDLSQAYLQMENTKDFQPSLATVTHRGLFHYK